jgi:hypothetical protein
VHKKEFWVNFGIYKDYTEMYSQHNIKKMKIIIMKINQFAKSLWVEIFANNRDKISDISFAGNAGSVRLSIDPIFSPEFKFRTSLTHMTLMLDYSVINTSTFTTYLP